ncbi:hypothetical protein [Candidatus Amarobacter glycogenicus]|uniref:hypothetical protein n=1 Tax=Candidatus Amarobacter glycogenicus TaxID=3140699 RepID=UPI003135B166|nr:hypothetical protein [Dehalococcoidia bacterium]
MRAIRLPGGRGAARGHQRGPNGQANLAANPAVPTTAALRTILLTGLYQLGAIRFGQFTPGERVPSPLYIDLRLLVSDPALCSRPRPPTPKALTGLSYDRLAGVPYAALPIGAVEPARGQTVALPGREAKTYGLGKSIEGALAARAARRRDRRPGHQWRQHLKTVELLRGGPAG